MKHTVKQPVKVRITTGNLTQDVIRCTTVSDVDCQQEIEPWLLAIVSLSPIVESRLCCSPYTRTVLIRLQNDYGAAVFRQCFRGLILDMSAGFKPNNPIGVLVARVRSQSVESYTIS